MSGRKHNKKTLLKMSGSQSGKKNPIYGTKRPKHVVEAMQKGRATKRFSSQEKIKRLVKLPNRVEVTISKGSKVIRCFSLSHASKLIGVEHPNLLKHLRKNALCKGWKLTRHEDKIYTEVTTKLIQMLENLVDVK